MLNEIWYTEAIIDVQQTSFFLQEKWGEEIAEKFLNSVQGAINKASRYPDACRLFDAEKGIRAIKIDKHNRLFFRIKDNAFHVLRVFPYKRNPVFLHFD